MRNHRFTNERKRKDSKRGRRVGTKQRVQEMLEEGLKLGTD